MSALTVTVVGGCAVLSLPFPFPPSGRSDSNFCLFAPTLHDAAVSARPGTTTFEAQLYNSQPASAGAEEGSGVAIAEGMPRDAVLHTLRSIRRGRPRLGDLLAGLAKEHASDDVIVMCCGPAPLILEVSDHAFRHKFHYHTEVFNF